LLWCGWAICQWVLGITTVLKNKPADIATAHVAVGALTLATGCLLIVAHRRLTSIAVFDPVTRANGTMPSNLAIRMG
jgi:heme A synthase